MGVYAGRAVAAATLAQSVAERASTAHAQALPPLAMRAKAVAMPALDPLAAFRAADRLHQQAREERRALEFAGEQAMLEAPQRWAFASGDRRRNRLEAGTRSAECSRG